MSRVLVVTLESAIARRTRWHGDQVVRERLLEQQLGRDMIVR